MNISRDQVTSAFAAYTAGYNANDPKIKLKIDHTYRVADFCDRIARTLPFTEDQVDFAWLSGMLHDVGRFEQIRRYHTFSDADSVSHACLGADLLFKEDLLENFVPDWAHRMTPEERSLLELAIRVHSAYRIPDGLSEFQAHICNILRDADKIDIFRVNVDTPVEDIYNVTTEALRRDPVSDAVKQCFREKHAVLRSLKQTSIDNIAAHACLYFELVYPISRKMTLDQGYLQQMITIETDNPDTRAWFDYMQDYFRKESHGQGQ